MKRMHKAGLVCRQAEPTGSGEYRATRLKSALRGPIRLGTNLVLVGVAAALSFSQARAGVILEAPVGLGSYYGLYSTSGIAAAFTLANTYDVSSIDVFVRTPASTSFTTFNVSLQNALTSPSKVFANGAFSVPLGVSTQSLTVNQKLLAGSYYLIVTVPGYVSVPPATPGDVDGWLISTGAYNTTGGTITSALNPSPAFRVNVMAQGAGNWTQQNPSTLPPPRAYHAMAFDSARGQVVLVGGGNSSGQPGGTWVLAGSNWMPKFPQSSPSVRSSHAMAYDSSHGQTILFGGNNPSGQLGDTWAWDGSNWTQKSPQSSPSARLLHAMAYDSAHGQVVMFGGLRGSGVNLNDTWTWDGSNWTQQSPQDSPSARNSPKMAYDSARGQVVLFGGFNSSGALGDTWVWDGSNWTQKSPQNSPSARVYHAMAYDSAHGQVVMFGGQGNVTLNDTWAWDGSNWTQKSPQDSPSARSGHAMVYDSAHGQTVLFGGQTTSTEILNETWTWEGGAGVPPAIAGVVSASAFGGFSSVAPGSWVEIYGTNLASQTRQWAGSDFDGNNAPTMLDGVQVVIGGQKAFVDFISSGQVNAQLPSNVGVGPMQITLTNGTVTSAPFNITVNTTQPGLLAPPSFKIGGNQYVVAQFSDLTYVLPAGSIAGVASRPAKPGETIVIYGVGFGPVIPNIPAGQIVTQTNRLSMPLQILFGQTPAQSSYFGLAPNYVGLYQFNVVVPAVANNDLVPLTFSLGGVAGTQTLYIAVRQ
jgi:uncharacterized protein (TIGR03437 family)